MFGTTFIEICAGSAEDVVTACRFPIDRIELNSALELGGLSPSLSVLRFAKAHTGIPVICMVRPRAAGFVYSDIEYEIMHEDAERFLNNGADGIVFGFLNPDHTVDSARTASLANLSHSYGKEAVFHRAFDLTADPFAAGKTLIDCHIDRVLTSGHKPNALSGAPLIKELKERFEPALSILPGAGINQKTVLPLLQATQTGQIHMTAKSMRNDDGEYPAADARNLQSVLSILRTHSASALSSVLTREDDEMLGMEHYERSLIE